MQGLLWMGEIPCPNKERSPDPNQLILTDLVAWVEPGQLYSVYHFKALGVVFCCCFFPGLTYLTHKIVYATLHVGRGHGV